MFVSVTGGPNTVHEEQHSHVLLLCGVQACLHSRIHFAVTQLLKAFHCANPEAENKQKKATSGNSFIGR